MTVGEKIRKTRKQKKMTQNTLAGLTGLAAITIRQYEAGKYIPKIENLRKISHASFGLHEKFLCQAPSE